MNSELNVKDIIKNFVIAMLNIDEVAGSSKNNKEGEINNG